MNLSQKLAAVEPKKTIYFEHAYDGEHYGYEERQDDKQREMIDRESFERMKAIAVELAKAVEEIALQYGPIPSRMPKFPDEVVKDTLTKCTELLEKDEKKQSGEKYK